MNTYTLKANVHFGLFTKTIESTNNTLNDCLAAIRVGMEYKEFVKELWITNTVSGVDWFHWKNGDKEFDMSVLQTLADNMGMPRREVP